MVLFCLGRIRFGFSADFGKKAVGLEIPAINVFYCGLVWMVLSIVLCVLFAKWVLRLDFSKVLINEQITAQYANKKATKPQKAGIVLLGIYIGLLLFANIFKTMLSQRLLILSVWLVFRLFI